MIWASVSSRSCFCWLYRASPSSAAKNIINPILVLTIWWCPCVEPSLELLEKGVAMTSVFSWQNSVGLCAPSIRTPRPNLPVILGVSWLPTFAFQPHMMKRYLLWGVLVLESIFRASLVAQTVKSLPAVQETQVQSLGQEDPLEKEMVTHSCILAWKILWTEEPSRLQYIL